MALTKIEACRGMWGWHAVPKPTEGRYWDDSVQGRQGIQRLHK